MSEIAFGDVPVLLRQILDRLNEIDGRLGGIESRLANIEHKQDDAHQQIEALNDRFDAMQSQMDKRFKNVGSVSGIGRTSGLARAATSHDKS